MSDAARVLELLEVALDSGRPPEEVCSNHPELLPELRRRWEQCRRIEAQMEELFPSGSGEDAARQKPHVEASLSRSRLPQVPGYEIDRILGHGGMGLVYRARHLRLKRTVALKMLLSGAYASQTEVARFLREAQAVAALRHANVVQVHDVGEFDGRPYFTMELLDGGSLADRLHGVPQPATDAATLLTTLAEAVEAAHRAEIIHRDLKPSNVLLTSDGTPKISDFGLALTTSEEESGLTLSGARLGTPSYMAPEQVLGRRGAVGPRSDVYALGAILYEMLTGRPPFRGESPGDTERQVIGDDPVPPSRLNPRVPRDLETICLTCLHKEPSRRYASAAAFAADLGRFSRGECITARPIGNAERALKWARRRPATAASLVGGIVVALALAGGALRLISERASAAHAVEQALRDVSALNAESRWADASATIDRAERRLGNLGPANLHGRLERARQDADFVRQLEAIRTDRATAPGAYEKMYPKAGDNYAVIFRTLGIGKYGDNPDAVAARISASDIRPALVAAVYDWMGCGGNWDRGQWLLKVARRADPDPTGWRDRALDRATWLDDTSAAAVGADPALALQSVELLFVVRDQMRAAYRDVIPFLARVQQTHPDNYWANLELGIAMYDAEDYVGAIRYGQPAVALRPQASMAHYLVGDCLLKSDRLEEAMVEYREALRLDPAAAVYRGSVGLVLARQGRYAEAIPELTSTMPRLNMFTTFLEALCDSLEALARFDEITRHYRDTFAGEPAQIWWQSKLRNTLVRCGKLDDVLAIWRETLDAPDDERACAGYPEYCLFVGRESEYQAACGVLMERYEQSTDPRECEHVARTYLLASRAERDVKRATAMIDRALASDHAHTGPLYPYFRAVKGLAEYRIGNHQAAIDIMEGDAATPLGPLPQLIASMAHWQLGQKSEARHALAAAILSYDWSVPFVEMTQRWRYRVLRRENPDDWEVAEAWIYHVLRREAEAMILPDLAAYLQGHYQPREINEKLAMTGACEFREFYAAEARLWADAFATDTPAARPGSKWAVRAAALAGCGQGKDAAAITETDRAHWRALARAWIRSEVDALVLGLDATGKESDAAQEQARDLIASWCRSPDLTLVRDATALAQLPAEEARDWTALWNRAKLTLEKTNRKLISLKAKPIIDAN